MVIGNLDIECVAVGKAKAEAPLIVDPDRMPAGAVACERFEPVRRRQAQILDAGRRIQLPQPHCGAPQDIARQPSRFAGGEEPLGFGIGKRSNHYAIYKQNVYISQASDGLYVDDS